MNCDTFWAIIFSGVGATILVLITEYFRLCQKRQYLWQSLGAELNLNFEFANHNKRTAHFIKNDPSSPFIFIRFSQAVAQEIIKTGDLKMDDATRDALYHYLAVLNHVASMIDHALAKRRIDDNTDVVNMNAIYDYCSTDELAVAEKLTSDSDRIISNLIKVEIVLKAQLQYFDKEFSLNRKLFSENDVQKSLSSMHRNE